MDDRVVTASAVDSGATLPSGADSAAPTGADSAAPPATSNAAEAVTNDADSTATDASDSRWLVYVTCAAGGCCLLLLLLVCVAAVVQRRRRREDDDDWDGKDLEQPRNSVSMFSTDTLYGTGSVARSTVVGKAPATDEHRGSLDGACEAPVVREALRSSAKTKKAQLRRDKMIAGEESDTLPPPLSSSISEAVSAATESASLADLFANAHNSNAFVRNDARKRARRKSADMGYGVLPSNHTMMPRSMPNSPGCRGNQEYDVFPNMLVYDDELPELADAESQSSMR